MLATTDFTTYDEIRAALGVSTTELTDRVLGLGIYQTAIEMSMDDIHEQVLVQYALIKDITPEDRTAPQAKFYRLARMHATYAAAKFSLSNIAMFSVQKLGDGKADFERFSGALEMIKGDINDMAASVSYRLGLALQALLGASIIVPTFSQSTISTAVGLAVDPVTTSA